jgi:hypothetical protein
MSKIVNPYKCDVCGTPKGEANKWLLGIPVLAAEVGSHLCKLIGPVYYDRDPDLYVNGYIILDWNDRTADTEHLKVHHLCSEKCALTKQAEYLRRPA